MAINSGDVQCRALSIAEKTLGLTSFESGSLQDDAAEYFKQLQSALPAVLRGADGSKIATKMSMLSSTISTEGTFKDMVKILWRMIREMSGNGSTKLTLFFIGLGAMSSALERLQKPAAVWMPVIEKWLGTQLTIGGKGVTGEGEGSVQDRVHRFFSTPYLHDFD